MGCIFPTMHCRSQHCWELLYPFAHHCQDARNNSQHCWRNNVGSCCVRLHVALRLIKFHFSCNLASLWIVIFIFIHHTGRSAIFRSGVAWVENRNKRKKMQIKIKVFIRYLWLLSLSTILTLWLFYTRWTHVRHMNAAKLRWAKPYTYLNFQFPLLFALYDW